MSTVTLEEAKARPRQAYRESRPGEELLITDQGQPLAHVKKARKRSSWPSKAGSAAGKIRMSPDFDEPLEEFREYME